MATCQLQPLGAYATTDTEGHAMIENVPAGEWQLEISYVGYETLRQKIVVGGEMNLMLELRQQTLALSDVEVVARQNTTGEATSSIIGRQAIDHLQANSLADIMQLIPGQLMTNSDLTSQSNLQLRTLVNNNTSAFGSSVVMDGVPISNNGALTTARVWNNLLPTLPKPAQRLCRRTGFTGSVLPFILTGFHALTAMRYLSVVGTVIFSISTCMPGRSSVRGSSKRPMPTRHCAILRGG